MKQISGPRCLIRFYSIKNAKSMKFAMIWTPIFLRLSLMCINELERPRTRHGDTGGSDDASDLLSVT
ncbi:MAG: hypothetical protein M2R45_03254 [Verrucomicrobia subdivision 3 bacterium]|nr:hypothetical protein [Limisphaerales bacterium]MCS1416115.1 hypothetical protein [Limisphaerales bacterium]